MSILARELRLLSIGPAFLHSIGPAAMMTALDLHGISPTLYLPSAEDADQSAADTRSSSAAGPFSVPVTMPLPGGVEALPLISSANPAKDADMMRACRALIAAAAELNTLDALGLS
jgi:triose/dihydroxyacetone kinase / FAD-AMP lyase (cyclizing)